MNTPNKLTVARMILVPFLVLVYSFTDLGGEGKPLYSTCYFCCCKCDRLV